VTTPVHQLDVAIIGAGIAGLWLLNLLQKRGYSAGLIENDSIGSGQSLKSQGMIHGGIKYALKGSTNHASETIADMPARWRACLTGEGCLDLVGVNILAREYYMFSDARLSSKVTAFFGSKAIEGRVTPVAKKDFPPVFQNSAFKGLLYRLQDLVVDTHSLLHHLSSKSINVFHGDPVIRHEAGRIDHIALGNGSRIKAHTYIFAAGQGNGALVEDLGLPLTMQLRPLHQVVVRGESLPDLFAHAVALKSIDKPRMTITTHPLAEGKAWYLGGLLAETGVERTTAEQIAFARKELQAIIPWVNLDDARFSTVRVNRAEAGQKELSRPDTPFVQRYDNTLVCWPTKLTLAPLMGDMVLSELNNPTSPQRWGINIAPPSMGLAPWETR